MLFRRLLIVGIKYVLAVVVSLHVAFWLSVPDYLSVSFIAVITLKPNLREGYDYSNVQLKGTIIGSLITLLMVLPTRGELHPELWHYQAAVAMGITIVTCLLLELGEGAVIGTFTVSYLTCLPMMIPGQEFMSTLHLRFLTIAVGIATGMILNYASSFFGYHDRLYLSIDDTSKSLKDLLVNLGDELPEDGTLRNQQLAAFLDEVQNLRQDLDDLEKDLCQVSGISNGGEFETSGSYEKYFHVLYSLKDLLHYLRSMLLRQVNDPVPESESSLVRESIEKVSRIYEKVNRLYKLEETERKQVVSSIEEDLSSLRAKLSPEDSRGKSPFLRDFLSLLDQLEESVESFENFAKSSLS